MLIEVWKKLSMFDVVQASLRRTWVKTIPSVETCFDVIDLVPHH